MGQLRRLRAKDPALQSAKVPLRLVSYLPHSHFETKFASQPLVYGDFLKHFYFPVAALHAWLVSPKVRNQSQHFEPVQT